MIQVEYSVDKKALESDYVKLFPYKNMQKRWKFFQNKHQNVLGLRQFPTVFQLLKLPIVSLVEVFFEYTEKIDAAIQAGILDNAGKKSMNKELSLIFNYDKAGGYRDNIADFLMADKNKFKIHVCHYCGMAYVNYFETKSGKNIRQFDIEHILDKGRCPLVSLSLYNFLPSCQSCNRTIKKSKCIGETNTAKSTGRLKEIIKKLSPTNHNYDFDGNMLFYIKPKNNLTSFENLLVHSEDFELDLHIDGDADYQYVAEQFYLKERYDYHKSEAFFLKDKLDHYPKSKIEEISNLVQLSPTDVANDLFGVDFHTTNHRTLSKLYRDIFKCYNLL